MLWLAEANDTELTLSAPPSAAVGKKVASLFEHYEFLMNLEAFYQPQGWSTCAAGPITTIRGDI